MGFVAGKKVGGIAKRNRFKRRTRAAVEARYDALERGVDLVFVLRAPIMAAGFGEIEAVVGDALAKAGVTVG